MARKSDAFTPDVDPINRVEAFEREGVRLNQDFGLKEQLIFTGSMDWTPEQTEQYIDWRIQTMDTEIAKIRQHLDDLIATRKRWLAVTGGRSKVSGNGHTNGNGGTNGVS